MKKKAAKSTKSSEDVKNFWNLMIFGKIMVIWMLVFWDKKL